MSGTPARAAEAGPCSARKSLVFERLCEHQQKLLERREVFMLDRRLDHGLNTMIARYEGGIDRAHPGAAFVRMYRALA